MDEIKQINSEIELSDEESRRRIAAGRKKDLDSSRTFLEGLEKLEEQTAKFTLDSLSTAQISRQDRIRALAEIEKAAVDRELDSIKQRLNAELELNRVLLTDDAATAAAKLENQKRLNASLAAEEARAKAEREAINRRATVETESASPDSFRSSFGNGPADLLGEAGTSLTGFAGVIAGLKSTIAADMNEIGNSITAPFASIGAVLGRTASGFIQTTIAAVASGKSIGAAMKAMASAVIGQIASIAAVEAVKNLAYGFNALGWTIFTADPKGALAASHYFASAALWGSLSAAAAVGAGAIGKVGNGVDSGRSASGGAFGGGTQEERESIFRTGDSRGRLNDPERDPDRGPFKLLAQMFREDQEIRREDQQLRREESALTREALSANTASNVDLKTKLKSMPAREVVAIAADEAPAIFAEADSRARDNNPAYTREDAQRLLLGY